MHQTKRLLCRRNGQLGFHRVFISLNVFSLLSNTARVGGFAHGLLDEREKPLLSIIHKGLEVVCAQKRRINQMRLQIAVKLLAVDRRRGVIPIFQLRDVLRWRNAANDPVGAI